MLYPAELRRIAFLHRCPEAAWSCGCVLEALRFRQVILQPLTGAVVDARRHASAATHAEV